MDDTIVFEWSLERWLPRAQQCGILADWLVGDVETTRSTIEWLLSELDRIERGEPPAPDEIVLPNNNENFIGSGNVFAMYASPSLFYLEDSSGSGPRLLMTQPQVRMVLETYRAFMTSGWRDKNLQPKPFAFEYIATDSQAYDLAKRAGLFVSGRRDN